MEGIKAEDYKKILKENTQLHANVLRLSGEVEDLVKYSQDKWTKHSARLKIFQAIAFSIAQKAIASGVFKVDDKEVEKLKKYKFDFTGEIKK